MRALFGLHPGLNRDSTESLSSRPPPLAPLWPAPGNSGRRLPSQWPQHRAPAGNVPQPRPSGHTVRRKHAQYRPSVRCARDKTTLAPPPHASNHYNARATRQRCHGAPPPQWQSAARRRRFRSLCGHPPYNPEHSNRPPPLPVAVRALGRQRRSLPLLAPLQPGHRRQQREAACLSAPPGNSGRRLPSQWPWHRAPAGGVPSPPPR